MTKFGRLSVFVTIFLSLNASFAYSQPGLETSYSYTHALDEYDLLGTATIESFSSEGIPKHIAIVIENQSNDKEYEFYVSRYENVSFLVIVLSESGQVIAHSELVAQREGTPDLYVQHVLLPGKSIKLGFEMSNLISIDSLDFEAGSDVRYKFQFYTPLILKNENLILGISVFDFNSDTFHIPRI